MDVGSAVQTGLPTTANTTPYKNSDQDHRVCPNIIKSIKKKKGNSDQVNLPAPHQCKDLTIAGSLWNLNYFLISWLGRDPSSWLSRPAFFSTMAPPTGQEGPGVRAFSYLHLSGTPWPPSRRKSEQGWRDVSVTAFLSGLEWRSPHSSWRSKNEGVSLPARCCPHRAPGPLSSRDRRRLRTEIAVSHPHFLPYRSHLPECSVHTEEETLHHTEALLVS